MSLNFDAQINLDVGPFLASIERARGAVKKLNADIDALNKKKINPGTSTPGGGSMPDRRREADAVHRQTQAVDANVRALARERYALYDVAATYTAVSGIAIGAVKGLTSAAIEYERAFADVNRTTDFVSITGKINGINEAARVMKYSLTQVAAEIPVAFGKVTEIATIGNQLGIAQGKLQSFSKTVAQFSTLTGMTASATAMSFGRIGELLNETDYNKLGSSIAYAGVKAVATEEQIASVTKEIATTAKMAKFTTPEVVGLATALSSVGIAPEAARGSIMRTFAGINQAVSEGGAKLQNYASISGMSAEEFSKSWTKNGQVAFDAFVKGLQGMSDNGQNLDTVLRSIGLKNVRDIQTIQKLGDNYNVYADSIRNANQAYAEGTFLGDAYGKIQDTVAAKLELLQNNWKNLQASLAEGVTGDIFKGFLDALNNTLKMLNDAARNPLVRDFIMPLILSLTTLIGVFAAINGVAALARASMLAYGTAMGVAKVAADGTTVSLEKAALAQKFFGTALKSVGWMLLISSIVEGLALIAAKMAPIEQQAESMLGGFAGLQDAFTADTTALYENAAAAGQTADQYAKANGIVLVHTDTLSNNATEAGKAAAAHNNVLAVVGSEPEYFNTSVGAIGNQTIAIGQNTVAWIKNALAQSDVVKNVSKNQDAINLLMKSGYNADAALSATFAGKGQAYFDALKKKIEGQKWSFPGLFNDAWVNANMLLENLQTGLQGSYNEILLLGLGADSTAAKTTSGLNKIKTQLDGVKKAATEAVRTVVDYANDLVGIFKRIDSIQFSKQTALDGIAAGWKKIKDDAASAADAIEKARQTIQELTSDKSILEFQLGVAVRYGDVRRAEAIRAKLAKNTTDLAKANTDLADAQAASSKSLTGTSESAAKNRATMVDMLGKYQDYIQALAATGMKGTELENAVAGLKTEFIAQGKELGFNTTELDRFAGQFDLYAKAVHDTPRDVTIEFDAKKSAEFNAVQEYLAKEHKLLVKVVRSDDGTLNSIATSTSTGSTGTGSTKTGLTGTTLTNSPVTPTTPAAPAGPAGLATYLKVYNDLKNEMTDWNKKNWFQQLLTKIPHAMILDNAMKYISNWELQNGTKYKPFDVKLAYANGGFVRGAGTSKSDSISAMLSNGEYVVNSSAVKTYGIDFMNSLNQMQLGRASMPSSGGSQQSGSQVIYLSPEDRQLLRAAIERPINLYADTTQLASTVSDGNALLAQRGLN